MKTFDEGPKLRPMLHLDDADEIEAPREGATIISILDRLPASARSRRVESSVDLVDRVAQRIGVMAGRTRELERYVEKFEQWSNAQVDAVEKVADHWKSVTSAAEMKMDELQRSLEYSKQRAELAECDLQNVRYRLELLHERIAKVFGDAAKVRARRELIDFD
jgi:hypothetical protein